MTVDEPAVPRRIRITAGGAALAAAVATGVLAWMLIAGPVATFAARPNHPEHFPLVFAHMLGGTLMLFLGAANLYIGTTRKFFRWHKVFGWLYLGGGAIAAPTAIYLALGLAQMHGEEASLAITLQGVTDVGWSLAALGAAWLAASALAFRAIKNRRIDQHRAWMIRSYVLTWSFVACRLLATQKPVAELGDGAAAVWLSWVVPLFVCEIALQWKAGGRARA